jgi:PPIC-type PPIASE domain
MNSGNQKQSWIARVIKEPLFSFMIVGGLIFAISAAVQPETPDTADNRIDVSDVVLDRLNTQFNAAWKRDPTSKEQQGLIDTYIREEVLVREALALSMDQSDAVIRRRLVQKMTFLMESASSGAQPSETELQTYFEANKDRYASDQKQSFEQVFLGAQVSKADAARALAALNAGTDPLSVGQPSLMPPALSQSPAQVVDATFGRGFFASLLSLSTGHWDGPVRSGYGYHLVRVTERPLATEPALADVKEQVIEDWAQQASDDISEKMYKSMLANFDVTLPDTQQNVTQ